MTKLILREGNLFHTEAPAIGHGINNKGVMGAGIALQFKTLYPEMYAVYQSACRAGQVRGGGSYGWDQENITVYNICSQEEPGANASYDFLIEGVTRTIQQMQWKSQKLLALPRIGSGIGGLNEQLVERILGFLAEQTEVDIELWTYKA